VPYRRAQRFLYNCHTAFRGYETIRTAFLRLGAPPWDADVMVRGRASREARRGRQYNGVNPERKDGFVRFSELVQYFLKLEGTSGRNALVEILAELFMRTPTEDVPPTAYLLQGRLAPYFEPVEIGLGNNYVADAIARAFGSDRATVLERFDRLGDIGEAAAEIAEESGSSPAPTRALRSVGSSTDSSR
jgi:hypothetical protein